MVRFQNYLGRDKVYSTTGLYRMFQEFRTVRLSSSYCTNAVSLMYVFVIILVRIGALDIKRNCMYG